MGDEDADRIRRLLAHRVPELSQGAIVEPLGESVWLDVVAAIGEVLGEMEAKLDAIGQHLTGTAARDEAPAYVEDAEDTTTVEQEGQGAFARRVA
jgi:hypothetical protein